MKSDTTGFPRNKTVFPIERENKISVQFDVKNHTKSISRFISSHSMVCLMCEKTHFICPVDFGYFPDIRSRTMAGTGRKYMDFDD